MTTHVISFDPTKTVREYAVELPNATRVFENLGIDYCCGGGNTLETACQKAGLPVEDVLKALDSDESNLKKAFETTDWTQKSLAELIEYIVGKHHSFTKMELPRLAKLLDKVYSVHGQNHPELRKVQNLFSELAQELTTHLMKEEQILFPYVVRLETAINKKGIPPLSCFGTIANPIRMMEFEHDHAGNVLKQLRVVTCDFTPPPDACFSYETLYSGLKGFELDLHQHIHLESNILFPRAFKLEEGYLAS